jgi:acyl-CoA synthetase (AMP-forming)/AMP-acid ligase II
MLRTIWGDPDRYVQQYWSRYEEQGWYLHRRQRPPDEDGYIWIIGRIDDVIKVSGYRLGTAEIESALVSHPAVAEAAVIGVPDQLRGNVIKAYCILRQGQEPSAALSRALDRPRRPRDGADCQALDGRIRRATAQDAFGQDHAPRAEGAMPLPAGCVRWVSLRATAWSSTCR